MFLYQLRDLQIAALTPWYFLALTAEKILRNPFVPMSATAFGKALAARAAFFEQSAKPYEKPAFDIRKTKFRNEPIGVKEVTLDSTPFCRLIHFQRVSDNEGIESHAARDPKVLIVTPLSGHFASLMRGTVEAMLPSHNVIVTDWTDAKMVPLTAGAFDLEDQIDYLARTIRKLGADLHIVAIHQASLSALCAVALLAEADDPVEPRTLTLIGGPIDAQKATCALSETASTSPMSWFRETQIQMVPPYYPGAMRLVYPGYMQLLDRMSLSFDRQLTEQSKYFEHLVRGDEESPEAHEKLYESFLSVMDVPAEFYLQYIERAYQQCALANGAFTWRGRRIDPGKITQTALFAIEGELDDLSPPGQTRAALDLCIHLPAKMKEAHLEIGVGHYGVFCGRKWRNNIQPAIHKFIRLHSLPPDEEAPVE